MSKKNNDPFPSLPKSSKYLLRRCLDPLKAEPQEVFGVPNTYSQGIWGENLSETHGNICHWLNLPPILRNLILKKHAKIHPVFLFPFHWWSIMNCDFPTVTASKNTSTGSKKSMLKTVPKLNRSPPENLPSQKRKLICKPSFFRGHVQFGGGVYMYLLIYPLNYPILRKWSLVCRN